MSVIRPLACAVSAAIILSACGGGNNTAPETLAKDRAAAIDALPVTSLVATHAFDLPAPAKAVGFIPDFSAPWLADIIILAEDGSVSATSIEGRSHNSVTTIAPITSIAGVPRKDQPALFLAVTDKGALQAYIKGEDGFESATLSVQPAPYKAVCQGHDLTENTIAAVTDAGIVTLTVATNDGVQTVTITDQVPFDAKGSVAACQGSMDKLFISMKDVSDQPDDRQHYSLNKGVVQAIDLSGAGTSVATLPDLQIGAFPENPLILMGEDLAPKQRFTIDNGFSVMGLNEAKFVNATSQNYGGPFSNGIIVLGDAEADRLVIISASYLRSAQDANATSTPETSQP